MPDVVILLPGITGSVLANAKGKEVWAPTLGAAWRAVVSGGESLTDLALADDDVDDGVTATRLMPDATIVPGLIKIDGYTRIEQWLVDRLDLRRGENFFPFPYDWRRDNRINAKRLESQAMDWLKQWRHRSGDANAKLVFVAHSMGGLIARYFVECLGGWQHTRRVITMGTPHRGSLNAVGFLEHGMKKGIGPFGVDLSAVLRSLTSVYQLLPIYPCIADGNAELKRVVDAVEAGTTTAIDVARAREARAFHDEIRAAQEANAHQAAYTERGPLLVPIVGIDQPTAQSARRVDGRIELLNEYESEDLGGDGTVPRASATPVDLGGENREIYAADMHGALQNAEAVLTNLHGVLTSQQIDFRRYMRAADVASLTLDVDDVVLPDEVLRLRVRPSAGNPAIRVKLEPLGGGQSFDEGLRAADEDGWQQGEFRVDAGAWRVTAYAGKASPVSDLVVVAQGSRE